VGVFACLFHLLEKEKIVRCKNEESCSSKEGIMERSKAERLNECHIAESNRQSAPTLSSVSIHILVIRQALVCLASIERPMNGTWSSLSTLSGTPIWSAC
jgi:hypothetical protein